MARTEVVPDVLSSPALDVLLTLERDGFRVELTPDDTLRIGPRDRLTPELVVALRHHKDSLKMLVRLCDDGVQDRRLVFVAQRAAAPPGTVPASLFRPGVPYAAGVCFSCGDRLPRPHFGRCWRCTLAWRLACRVPIAVELAEVYDQQKLLA